MRGANQKIILTFLVVSFLFAPSLIQAADFQTARVKTAVASDFFTGNVVGVSDGDTISNMLEIEALRQLLFEKGIAKDEFITKFKQLDREM